MKSELTLTKMFHRLHLGVALAFYLVAATVVVIYTLDCWRNNEAFYKVEVDYVKWVTGLPAYTVCPDIKTSAVAEQLHRLTGVSNSQVVRFVGGLMTTKHRYCNNCDSEYVKTVFKNDLKSWTELLTVSCESLLIQCSWNNEIFQCCRHFQKIYTTKGYCYSINSAYVKEPEPFIQDMTTSFIKPDGTLQLELMAPVTIHVHDNKNLDLAREKKSFVKKINTGQKAEIVYKFMEWTEDSSAWLLSTKRRNCILANERPLDGFKVYSESACRMRCTVRMQLQKCGCKHHLLPGLDTDKDCDLEGLMCLDDKLGEYNPQPFLFFVTTFMSGRDKKHSQFKSSCGCLKECSRLDVTYIQYSIENSSVAATSKVMVKLTGPPSERIVLASKISVVSLIVSVACLSRLFTRKSLPELIHDVYSILRAFRSSDGILSEESSHR